MMKAQLLLWRNAWLCIWHSRVPYEVSEGVTEQSTGNLIGLAVYDEEQQNGETAPESLSSGDSHAQHQKWIFGKQLQIRWVGHS